MLLKKLTELNGVSGNEDDVRNYILSIAKEYADNIKIDSIGNLIAYKKGKDSRYNVMLSAHMDEVGLMVTGFGELGTIKFKTVGGIDERILIGKRVLVGDKKIPGVIGCKPIHMQDRDERNRNIKLKNLYIDIGSDKKDETEKVVSLGDYISFYSEYVEIGENCVKAKALDDRVGCVVLLEMLKNQYSFDLYACFTVQEEVGLRGAQVASEYVKPDICLVIEGTTCSDVPNVPKYEHSTMLGSGAALTIMDRTSYPDKKLVKFIDKTAKENGLKIQYKQTTTGGNDAGRIQVSGKGIKVASISVPCRYIHSPVSLMSMNDFMECQKLTESVLNEFSKDQNNINDILIGGKNNV